MGIDIWEVIGAASTKPFGFMPFFIRVRDWAEHCIPIDPFYLTWKAREYGQPHAVSSSSPARLIPPCPSTSSPAWPRRSMPKRKSVNGSRILVLGAGLQGQTWMTTAKSPSLRADGPAEKTAGAKSGLSRPPRPGHPPQPRTWSLGRRQIGQNGTGKTIAAFDVVLISTAPPAR